MGGVTWGPLRETPDGVELRVWAQPGASTSEIVGIQGQALKIRLAAPAQEGRANAALLTVLARALGIPKSQVTLLQGQKSREKIIFIRNLTAQEVAQRLGLT